MKIEAILARKGSDVISLCPEDTIQTAAMLLTTHRIGALPVKNAAHELVGIISERDFVKGFHAHGGSFVSMKVQDLMTREVTTCGVEDDVQEVQTIMHQGRFRHIPVIGDGKLLGVVSQGDAVQMCLEKAKDEANVMRDLAIARG